MGTKVDKKTKGPLYSSLKSVVSILDDPDLTRAASEVVVFDEVYRPARNATVVQCLRPELPTFIFPGNFAETSVVVSECQDVSLDYESEGNPVQSLRRLAVFTPCDFIASGHVDVFHFMYPFSG